MESKEEIGLPHHLFTNTITALDLDEAITNAQNLDPNELSQLQQNYPITKTRSHWYLTNRLVVVGNNDLRKGIITLYHNFPTARHAGGHKTLLMINKDYGWPSMRKNVAEFVKGCAICQSTKP